LVFALLGVHLRFGGNFRNLSLIDLGGGRPVRLHFILIEVMFSLFFSGQHRVFVKKMMLGSGAAILTRRFSGSSEGNSWFTQLMRMSESGLDSAVGLLE
jgi:hypothetical protein